MEQVTNRAITHSPTKRLVTHSHSIVDLAKITQRNEVKMKELIRKAKEIEKSGKTQDFENLRQCRFCYEEQYLSRIEESKQKKNNTINIQQPAISTIEKN